MELGRRGFLGLLGVAPVSLKNAVKDLASRNVAGLYNPLNHGLADAIKGQVDEDAVDPLDPEVKSEEDYYRRNMREFLNLFRGKRIPTWKLAQSFQQARHEALNNIPLNIKGLRSVSEIGKYNMAAKHHFNRSFENEYNNLLLDIQRGDWENKVKIMPRKVKASASRKGW